MASQRRQYRCCSPADVPQVDHGVDRTDTLADCVGCVKVWRNGLLVRHGNAEAVQQAAEAVHEVVHVIDRKIEVDHVQAVVLKETVEQDVAPAFADRVADQAEQSGVAVQSCAVVDGAHGLSRNLARC